MSKLSGRCLCGAVTYRCEAEPVMTGLCHCRNCQRQSGTAFSVVVGVPKGSLRITGDTLKTFDDVGESGLPVRRRFCGRCGSPIMSDLAAIPALDFIKAGTLDDTSWLNPTLEVWCESAQPWTQSAATRLRAPRNPPAS